MDEDAAVEAVFVRRAFQELFDAPFQTFDVDLALGIDFPLTVVGGVGRRSDYMVIVDGCNGTVAGFGVTGKELVESLPATHRHVVVAHVVAR